MPRCAPHVVPGVEEAVLFDGPEGPVKDECRTGVSAGKSTIQHARARNWKYASKSFGEKGVIESCYRSLAYEDL